MPQVTFAVQPVSPPALFGGAQPRRLSDNAWGFAFFAGTLATLGVVVWATSRLVPDKLLLNGASASNPSPSARNENGLTWQRWLAAARFAQPATTREPPAEWRRLWREGVDPAEVSQP